MSEQQTAAPWLVAAALAVATGVFLLAFPLDADLGLVGGVVPGAVCLAFAAYAVVRAVRARRR